MPLQVFENAPLRRFNTFGVDARARFLVRLATMDDLALLDTQPLLSGLKRLIVGGGSNLLLTGDFDGVVVKVDLPGRKTVGDTSDAWLVEVGAGENWHTTVEALLADALPGLENLALIPGQVGAAPIQNIGAYGSSLPSASTACVPGISSSTGW